MDYFILTQTDLFRGVEGRVNCNLSEAYNDFVKQTVELCSHSDLNMAFIALTCSEIELRYHHAFQNHENADEQTIYLRKALAFIHQMIKHLTSSVPMLPPQINPEEGTSSLHWKGTLVGLMELIASLDYSRMITDGNGKPQSFAAIVSSFERLFNVSFPKPYDLRADLARRKKSLSVLLSQLKDTYEKNIVGCSMGSK